MSRRRLAQPYRAYDPDSETLNTATHAPGQGGSSGDAIKVLSNWPQFKSGSTPQGASNMALPSRYVNTGPSQLRSSGTAPGAYDQSNRINLANQYAYEGAMEEQGRTRMLEEMARRRREQTEDRTFERDGLHSDRDFSEGGRQFDSRMNILREMFSRPQTPYSQLPAPSYGGRGGMNDASSSRSNSMMTGDMQGQISNYLSRLLGGR